MTCVVFRAANRTLNYNLSYHIPYNKTSRTRGCGLQYKKILMDRSSNEPGGTHWCTDYIGTKVPVL